MKTQPIFLLSSGCFPLRPSSSPSRYRLCIFICKFFLTRGPSLNICCLRFTALCVNAHCRAYNWFPAWEALLWQECRALWLDICSPWPHAPAHFLIKNTVNAVWAGRCLLPEDSSVLCVNVFLIFYNYENMITHF